jgi:hypothetical protein
MGPVLTTGSADSTSRSELGTMASWDFSERIRSHLTRRLWRSTSRSKQG